MKSTRSVSVKLAAVAAVAVATFGLTACSSNHKGHVVPSEDPTSLQTKPNPTN